MPGDDPLDEPPGRFVVHPERAAAATRATPWTVIGAAVVVSVLALAAWGTIRTTSTRRPVRRDRAPAPRGAAPMRPGAPAATPGLEVADVDTADEALARLAALAGWGGCPVWRALETGDPVTRTQAEAAIRRAGRETGMVEVPDAAGVPRRVWIGGDVQAAARGFGGSFIVREPDAAWTVVREDGREVAIRLAASARRDGGT